MRSLPVGPYQNNNKEKHAICRKFCYCFSLQTGGLVLGILHIMIAILIFSGSLYVVIYSFPKNYDFYDFMDVNNELIPRMYGEFWLVLIFFYKIIFEYQISAYIAIFTSIASFSLIDIIFGFVLIIGVIQVWYTAVLAGLYFGGAFKKKWSLTSLSQTFFVKPWHWSLDCVSPPNSEWLNSKPFVLFISFQFYTAKSPKDETVLDGVDHQQINILNSSYTFLCISYFTWNWHYWFLFHGWILVLNFSYFPCSRHFYLH